MKISVSEKVYTEILQIIEALQKESPWKPVMQKQVYDKLRRRVHCKSLLSARHVRRAFSKLVNDEKIVKSGRGQYWLPEYLERNINYLKRRIEFEKDFWRIVDTQRLKRITELEQKLEELERHQDRQEILRELREKSL